MQQLVMCIVYDVFVHTGEAGRLSWKHKHAGQSERSSLCVHSNAGKIVTVKYSYGSTNITW